MPIPLIPIAIVAVAVALSGGGLALVLRRISRTLAGKRVAILGRRQVGKTALLTILRDRDAPERSLTSGEPSLSGRFELEVNRQTVEFSVPRDLPGKDDELGFALWKEAFHRADYVWYLFRADLIADGDNQTVQGVKDHLDRFKEWLDSGATADPKIILIGVYADRATEFEESPARFEDSVRSADPIKIGLVKLSATLVIGSLLTEKAAKRLIRGLGASI